jgi:hypothetical protein
MAPPQDRPDSSPRQGAVFPHWSQTNDRLCVSSPGDFDTASNTRSIWPLV